MSIGTTAAVLVAGGLGAAGAIGGSLIQSNSASNAADKVSQSEANSLAFQEQEFNTEQANEAPWLAAGKTALGQLSAGTAPGGQFESTYSPFTAPTGVDESNDPGYAFRLQQGQQALERSAAARGTGTGGAALKAAEQYGQDYSSNEYSNVYNRAIQSYDTNFGVYNTDQTNNYNRLANIAGLGQTANSTLASAGQSAANNISNTNTTNANTLAGLTTGAGNSLSAGLAGATNSLSGGVNNYQNYQLLQSLLNQNNSGYVSPPAGTGVVPPANYYQT